MSAEARLQAYLQKNELQLPPAPKPAGVYKPVLIVGNMAYVSGHGPLRPDGTMIVGRVGVELDQHEGYLAARQVGLAILATLKANLGSLDRVKQVVKTLGMVNGPPGFDNHPAVVNGFSELFAEIFGHDAGVGARSAVGMSSLPGDIAVEVETIVLID